jgi:hypothetical protein
MNPDNSMAASRFRRLARDAGLTAAGLVFSLALSGCPVGADLENPERFPLVEPATGGTGGSGTGMGGSAAGTAGSATGGAGGGFPNFGCDLTEAFGKNCGRTGCHSAAVHYSNLTLVDPNAVAAQMVGVQATHGDIDCAAEGEPFRACTVDELPSKGCPPNALLIDPVNFDQSWVVQKMDPNYVGTCGAKMPSAPGNSASNGWSEERRLCLLDFFRYLATSQ